MDFDRNQIKEFIQRVEDDTARFIGAEFSAARVIGFIYRQMELGEVSPGQASQLLDDIQRLAMLAKLGHRYAKWARHPPAEVEIMVLSNHEREKGEHGT